MVNGLGDGRNQVKEIVDVVDCGRNYSYHNRSS